MVTFKVIAAACDNMGIGNKNALPWRLKKELQYFTHMTTATTDTNKKNAVIMGRKTWDSIPLKFKPLPKRLNIVLSKKINESGIENVPVYESLEMAIATLGERPLSEIIETVWIIGGALLYEEAINSSLCDSIYLTRVQGTFECDTYFPKIPDCYQEICEEKVPIEIQEENGISFRFSVLKRRNNK